MSEAPSPTPVYTNIKIAGAVVALLWATHIINILLHSRLLQYGIIPRNPVGLRGILTAPFIHGGFQHLISNSGALFALLAVSLSLSRRMTWQAIAVIMVGGGGAVWVFGAPNTVHVGASGLIFGLVGFLICIGIFQRKWKPLLFSILVFLMYGGVLWSLLIWRPGVSWSSHFWGLAFGVVAAWVLRNADTT